MAVLVQHELLFEIVVQLVDAGLKERADKVRARHVKVGEVRRVGLVEVIVTFPERRVRGGDYGQEER